jgi:hypothetical protein
MWGLFSQVRSQPADEMEEDGGARLGRRVGAGLVPREAGFGLNRPDYVSERMFSGQEPRTHAEHAEHGPGASHMRNNSSS